MIVNGAALPGAPAKDQRMIRTAGAHEIAAVAFAREPNVRLDLIPVDLEAFETFNEQIQRNAMRERVKLLEELDKSNFARDLHGSGRAGIVQLKGQQ